MKEDCNIKINGYQIFHSLGIINKSDGVSVLISNNCKLDKMCTQIIDNCSSIQLYVDKGGSQYIVTGIYRSQCYDTKQFITSLDNYLSDNDFKNDHIICGDININLFSNCYESNAYLNTLAKFGYTSAINDFTRVSGNSKTCIDHIFIKQYKLAADYTIFDSGRLNAYILKCNITDHFSTIIIIDEILQFRVINNPVPDTERLFINFDHLNMLISTENWYWLYNYNCVDTILEKFNQVLNSFINLSSTNVKRCRSKYKKIKQWITRGLITSIRNREK